MKKGEVMFSGFGIGFSIEILWIIGNCLDVFFRNVTLEIINIKSYTKFVKNNFPLFHEITPTLKSSLEKLLVGFSWNLF